MSPIIVSHYDKSILSHSFLTSLNFPFPADATVVHWENWVRENGMSTRVNNNCYLWPLHPCRIVPCGQTVISFLSRLPAHVHHFHVVLKKNFPHSKNSFIKFLSTSCNCSQTAFSLDRDFNRISHEEFFCALIKKEDWNIFGRHTISSHLLYSDGKEIIIERINSI